MDEVYTHYLTWIAMGDTASAVTTPIEQGLAAHEKHVDEVVAEYPDDENGERPDLDVSSPYEAVAYADLPDEMCQVALDNTDPDLSAIGAEFHGSTWYGREVVYHP